MTFNAEEFKGKLIKKGIATEGGIQGASEADIEQLESSFGLELPRSYKQFLRMFGKKAGSLFSDVAFFYPEVVGLREELDEMIEEESLAITLPEDSFVFSGYQGFQYHYFICDGTEDPAVYRVMDGGDPPEKVSESFSAYLESAVAR